MKKTLTALVAVLALSACAWEDAPTVESPDSPTHSEAYEVGRDMLSMAWDNSSDYEQHRLCGAWEMLPEVAHETLSEVISDPQAIDDHFNSVCYGN